VLETQSRDHVEARLRAGLLEWTTVELLVEAGVGARILREGLVHDGFDIAFANGRHRIDLKGLTGRSMLVYGQNELQRDLADARAAEPGAVLWEAREVAVHDFDTRAARATYLHRGTRHELRCDFIVGCDGFHGVCRASVAPDRRSEYERGYPFAWLGLLADGPPPHGELVYANHESGFALCSMRSRGRSRYYVQCPRADRVESWPDSRFWDELRARLPEAYRVRLTTGTSLEK